MSTIEALRLVNTDHIAAFETGPSFLFVSNEMSYPEFPDILQILEHAHAIFGSIPFIQMAQSGARETVASEAVFALGGRHLLTVLNAAHSGGVRFEMIAAPASRTCLLLPPKCPAEAAVHSAGSD